MTEPRESKALIRTVLICHDDAPLDHEGLARWMGSFSHLAGIVRIREGRAALGGRLRRELKRSGPLRLLDVLAFRAYYRLVLAGADRRWTEERLSELKSRYTSVEPPVLDVATPNSAEAQAFIRSLGPDIVLARCKYLLTSAIFNLPRCGTFVLHPGICPEYRNAHGCFWALAKGDVGRVGVTLLRIDEGVDTGPVYGYYSYPYDEVNESSYRIQWRCVLENLDEIATRFGQIAAGAARAIDTSGRESAVYGQPWLTRYVAWKRQARRRT